MAERFGEREAMSFFIQSRAQCRRFAGAPFPRAPRTARMLANQVQRYRDMKRSILALAMCVALSGCGLGETAVSAAAGGASAVEQAKEGLKTEALVKQQLDAAATLDAQRRAAADTDSQ